MSNGSEVVLQYALLYKADDAYPDALSLKNVELLNVLRNGVRRPVNDIG